ncbi:MAG: Rpn family recombination-promoting nuclease/putative transposase [Lachnospiraceae bacterium]|nr:Rpn family recombination-promoting nuclease/putative transposase [Lachnospiraceae bacterium]
MTKTDLNEMNLIDDFLMKLVASNPDYGDDFCRTLLSVLLEKKIGKVKVVAQSVIPGISPLHRGVRLDVEVEEIEDKNDDEFTANVYDIEPHTVNDCDFPKMIRFRQAKIDSKHMKSGDNEFGHLPNLYIIFIMNFDYFKKGYMIYSIRKMCENVPDVEFDDGVRYLVFNTDGTKGGSESIRNMLKYICNSKPEGVVDAATKEVDEYVSNIRHDPDVLEGVMTVGDVIDREKKESFDLGMKQGIDKGKAAIIAQMLDNGKSVKEISEFIGIPEEDINSIIDK